MKSPLVILLELFVGLVRSVIDTTQFVALKLIELFVTLGFIAGSSILGLVIAVAIAASVLLFVMKFVFGASKDLIIFVFFAALMFIIVILVGAA